MTCGRVHVQPLEIGFLQRLNSHSFTFSTILYKEKLIFRLTDPCDRLIFFFKTQNLWRLKH